MSADIEGRRTTHKAALLGDEGREKEQLSAREGGDIPSPLPLLQNPSCQSLQRNGHFIFRTLGQCSRPAEVSRGGRCASLETRRERGRGGGGMCL